MFQYFECRHGLPTRAVKNGNFSRSGKEIFAVRIAQPEIEASITKEPDKKSVTATIVEEPAVWIVAEPNDRLGTIGKLEIPRDHPKILPRDGGRIGSLKPVWFFRLNKPATWATKVSGTNVAKNRRAAPILDCGVTDTASRTSV
jgi:hypothetical protein